MTSQSQASDMPTADAGLPLFYRAPQPLSGQLHGTWRLKDGDLAFAAGTPFVPIVVGELAATSRDYPVVFAGGTAQPLALLGLDDRNLFVTDGVWTEGHYIPAYVRRYPFGFAETVDPDGFILAIDSASERVVPSGEAGAALFEAGKPSPLTEQALAFCDVFQGEALATRAFAEALRAEQLLIDRRADATLPDGRTLGVEGFQIVDAEKFAALDVAVIVDWHRRGWLALVHFHLASLERFSALLARQAMVTTTVATPPSLEA